MTEMVTASRKDVAGFLGLLKKNGGAVELERFLREEKKSRWVAADRALNEQLVRGHSRRGAGPGDPEVAYFTQIHLTTAGEKFLKDWWWRWWRWPALAVGVFVGLESLIAVVREILTLLP